jgi:ABC-type glycerol-3-phosphate transport system substrate-binding protein
MECDCEAHCGNESSNVTTVRILPFPSRLGVGWMYKKAAQFNAINEDIAIVPVLSNVSSLAEYHLEEIAKDQGSKYDAFLFLPSYLGILVTNQAIQDLTNFVKKSDDLLMNWADILNFNRQYNGLFDNKIFSFPIDDCGTTMFYRKDLFESHNITIPRTWQEYNAAAKYFDEMSNLESDGAIFAGSCVKRAMGCGIIYHFYGILGPIVQSKGSIQGSLIDYESQKVIAKEALVEAFDLLFEQFKYGHPTGK